MSRPPRGLLLVLILAMILDVLRWRAISAHEGIYYQDFWGLWSAAQFLRTHPAAALYQPLTLDSWQHHFGPGFTQFYPFAYPPSFLVFLLPLKYLGYWVARLLWSGLSAALFGWVLWRALADTPWRGWGMALVFLAPASFNNIITGETGFWTSALLLAGVRLLPARSVLPGICFGLLTFKPQLCILLPFALAGAGAWRATVSAFSAAVLLAGVSVCLFPPALWWGWLRALGAYQGLEWQNIAHLAPLMTGFAATAQTMGLRQNVVLIVTLLGIVALGLGIYAAYRRRAPLAGPALLSGTFAATPHAYFYDAPASLAAVLELWRMRAGLPVQVLGAALLLYPAYAGGPLFGITPASFLFALLFLYLLRKPRLAARESAY